MKNLFKNILVSILGWQVRRLYKKADFKVVAVAGSIGKTSTKFATATVLKEKFKVRYQTGNYNHLVTVPLIFFGQNQPGLMNPFGWAKAIINAEMQLHRPYPFDVVVIELGTDMPGDIAEFNRYLRVDIGVLTAIAPEHMEFFETMQAVADEEIMIAAMSEKVILNSDFCDKKYLKHLEGLIKYGQTGEPDYKLEQIRYDDRGFEYRILKNKKILAKQIYGGAAEPQLYSITAAAAVGDLLGMNKSQIESGISKVQPVNGRMKQLKGIKQSTILDDTYNASPEATKAALDTLYRMEAPQKIALLGNMNELGKLSARLHEEIGGYCESDELDLVVTLGPDANKYLAPAAEKAGCRVIKSRDALHAAEIIKENLISRALILAKGSQNGVFAEESVKNLLADSGDSDLLVRQTDQWLKKKRKLINSTPS